MNELRKESRILLRKCLMIHKPSLLPWIRSDILYELKPNQYNQLRSIVNDEFLLAGIDEDFEPNEYGLKLEKLIDELGRLFM